ncbi:DUF4382 domain-containing protein [Microbacter margulisiae]|uniref:DUF4382 domain-containing protein n=1 Tax=Microbacter margulisiae TaxID=1350067 RepID=A0A7W5DRB7_9PORP|nr:DUF4382 domain-containing protein [Microbacter margulisiae]MBB3187660.1 hypothetical protein [Microbacter margulisiae]
MNSWKILLITLGFISLVSCGTNTPAPSATTQNVFFLLADDPATQDFQLNFTRVNVDIKELDYVASDSSITKVALTDSVYNLKSLMNGNSVLLSQITLSKSVTIKQIHVVFGGDNYGTLKNGTIVPLTISGGIQSGVTINVDETAPSTLSSYSVIIDFNVGKSIFSTGNNTYTLNPTLRSYIADVTSYIKGNITPAKLLTKVFVVTGSDTLWTVADTTNKNYFRISGLIPGTYTVQFMPTDTTVVTNTASATVQSGSNVSLDTIRITQ